jgi:tetratricopeptide (TPR) repeat protein
MKVRLLIVAAIFFACSVATPSYAAIDLGLCPAVEKVLDPNGDGTFRDGSDKDALDAATNCIAADRGKGLLSKAYVLRRLGQINEARSAVTEGLAAGGDRVVGQHILCALATAAEDFDNARLACNAAIAAAPGRALGYFELGQTEFSAKRWPEALSGFDAAIMRGAANDAEVWLRRGQVLANLGRWNVALASFRRSTGLAPSYPAPVVEAGRALVALHRDAEAALLLDGLFLTEPKSNGAHLWHGQAMENLQRYQEAFADYDAEMILQPKWAYAAFERATMQEQLGRQQAALDDYALAIELDPKLAAAYKWRGFLRTLMHQFKDAESDFTHAIELNSKDVYSWNGRAATRLKVNDRQGAALDLERALAINPNFSESLINRGFLKYEMGELNGAIIDYSVALINNPKAQAARFWRARTFTDLKSNNSAIYDYTELLKTNPRYMWAYYNRGELISQKEDCEPSLPDFAVFIHGMPGQGYPWVHSTDCVGARADHGVGWWEENKVEWTDAPDSVDKYLAGAIHQAFARDGAGTRMMIARAAAIDPRDPLVKQLVAILEKQENNANRHMLDELDVLTTPGGE